MMYPFLFYQHTMETNIYSIIKYIIQLYYFSNNTFLLVKIPKFMKGMKNLILFSMTSTTYLMTKLSIFVFMIIDGK